MPIRRTAALLCLAVTAALTAGLAAPATAAAPVRSSVSAKASATRAYVDRPITLTGRVSPVPANRRVHLQTYFAGQWADLPWIAATTNARGDYRLAVPTGYRGARTYRVHAPAAGPVRAATSRAVKVAVVPKPVPRSSSFSLLYPMDNGTWMRWNPCQPVTYRVNPGPLGRGAIRDTQGAVARLSKATGIRFVYKGTTRAVPERRGSKHPKDANLLVAWVRPGTSGWMPKPPRGRRGPAGMGSATAWAPAYTAAGLRTDQITQAQVVLDASLPLAGGFGSGPRYGWFGTRGQLAMHEIAHASGLGHTNDRRQIMYGTLGRKPAAYGKGDLAGLRLIGKSQGCLTRTPPKRR